MSRTLSTKSLWIGNLFSLTVAIVLWAIFFMYFFSGQTFKAPAFIPVLPYLVAVPIYMLCAFIIIFKSRQHNGILLYALFLSLLSQNYVLQFFPLINPAWSYPYAVGLSFAITTVVFIKALQTFPRQLTAKDINSVFPKHKRLAAYLSWSLGKTISFVVPVLTMLIVLLNPASPGYLGLALIIVTQFTALTCFYANYRKTPASDRNKVLWLFWGMLAYIFIIVLQMLVKGFNGDPGVTAKFFFTLIKAVAITISLVMSLFFFNTFDTGTIVRRTIVDGSIFIIIVLVYNTVEHYFLHWLSHVLHLSDVLISSFLSGLFVLIFSPLHHKLMHFLQHRLKHHDAPTAPERHGKS